MRGLVAIALLGIGGCQTKTVVAPAPANVPAAAPLSDATASRLSQISAQAEAADTANAKQPPSVVTSAVAGPLSVIRNLAGPSFTQDRANALATMNEALAGKAADAEAGWAKARNDANALNARIAQLEKDVEQQKREAAAELTRQLQAAHDEERAKAQADQRRMIGWIFYGGAFLLGVAAGLTLALAGTIPMLGPKVAICLGGCAAGSALMGALLNELLAHPGILWTIMALIVAGLAGAVGLAYSNHQHSKPPTPAV